MIYYKQVKSAFIIKLLGQKDTIAMTIWPFIITRDATISAETLRHEKVHLKQQLRGWLIGFYIKYFYYQWKYGYKNNPYEIEARNKTSL